MAKKSKKSTSKKSLPKSASQKASRSSRNAKPARKPVKKPAAKRVSKPKATAKVKGRPAAKAKARPSPRPARREAREEIAEPPAPHRPPRRMIFGAAQGPVVVSTREPAEPPPPVPEADYPTVPEKREPQVEPELPPPPKISWSELPENFPPFVRFLLSNAEKECERIGTWPFPFARFIADLPREVSGSGLALMIMKRDMDEERLAETCRVSPAEVNSMLSAAQRDIEESFSSKCGEIYRKWRAQLATPGKRAEAMCEPHLLSKVDRSFQLMIGELVIHAIRAS